MIRVARIARRCRVFQSAKRRDGRHPRQPPGQDPVGALLRRRIVSYYSHQQSRAHHLWVSFAVFLGGRPDGDYHCPRMGITTGGVHRFPRYITRHLCKGMSSPNIFRSQPHLWPGRHTKNQLTHVHSAKEVLHSHDSCRGVLGAQVSAQKFAWKKEF